jgi:hypothetical protein
MAVTEEKGAATNVVYDLQGTLLEACTCGVLCPCWIGEDPDKGTCDAIVAYHYDRGTVKGIDIGGVSMVLAAHIPGNILQGNWKVAVFVDDAASDEQMQALLDAYTGKLGGPLADLAGLIGEVKGIERAGITHQITDGDGTLKVGDVMESEMSPYRGPDGTITTLTNTVFTTVPGSPAYVSKTSHTRVDLPQYGMVWSVEGKNAIQSDYRITYEEAA